MVAPWAAWPQLVWDSGHGWNRGEERPAPHAHVGEGERLVTVLCDDMAAGTGTSWVVVVVGLLRVLRVGGGSRALWRISKKTTLRS